MLKEAVFLMVAMSKFPKKGLIMAHLNVCSLRNKVHEVQRLASQYSIHIFTVSETHLEPAFSNAEVSIEGYNLFRKDRNKYGGGVAIYIQSHIPAESVDCLSIDGSIEAVWVLVHLPHTKPILIGCCYRPPNSDMNYLSAVCSMVDKASDGSREVYVFGDMNINWFSDKCNMKSKLLSMAQACNMTQMVSHPTRIFTNKHGSTSSTCLDLIFTNFPERCSKAFSVEVGFTDHNLVVLSRTTKIPKGGNQIINKRSYKHLKKEVFVGEVQQVNWSIVCKEKNPEIALNVFMKLLMEIVNKHAPFRKFTVKSKSAPWLDKEILDLMTLRDNAKKTAHKSGLRSDRQIYCQLRNKVTWLNTKKKKDYYKHRINEAKNDGKKLWSTLNEIMGRKSNTPISFIQSEGKYITKPDDIANHFNDFFKNKVDKLREGQQSSDGSLSRTLIKKEIMKDKSCLFQFNQVERETVVKLIMSQADSTSSGIDNLDSRILKLVVNSVATPICHIFNQCLQSGVHPTLWKEAKIIPLPKDKNKSFTGPNSRPISILPLLSKILEKIVFKQVMDYFATNNLLSPFQHAYREGHSTSTALLQMNDDWLSFMDNKHLVGAVMLDFSAAFDVIDYTLLIDKLQCYGFTSNALTWFTNYLSGRQQRVFFNGSYSKCNPINCGVPQGSCLGPLLYSIFTNDLPLGVRNVHTLMYADDTTLYSASTSEQAVTDTLNMALADIYKWIESNKLVLNISKTKAIVLGSRHMLCKNPQLKLSIGSTDIEQVNTIKLLGVTIESSLSWSKHINNIVVKMGRGIGMTRKCSAFITPSIMKSVIHSLVLSHLEYCPVIWSSATKSDLKKLQTAQNKAARLALGCSYRTSISYMHERLAWLMVEKKMAVSLLMLMRNIISTGKPCSLAEQLKMTSEHGYNTRGAASGNIKIKTRPKSNCLKHTGIYRSITLWNTLPNAISSTIHNKTTFKKNIKRYLAKLPST